MSKSLKFNPDPGIKSSLFPLSPISPLNPISVALEDEETKRTSILMHLTSIAEQFHKLKKREG